MYFVFLQAISAQSLPSNFRQPILTETIIETISRKNGNTYTYCKDLSSAIQSVVTSNLQKGKLPTELSNVCSCKLCSKNNPSASEIGNFCTCPFCSQNSCPYSKSNVCSCQVCSNNNPSVSNIGNFCTCPLCSQNSSPFYKSDICSCQFCSNNNPSLSDIVNYCTCPLCSKNSYPFPRSTLRSCPFCTPNNINNGQLAYPPLVQGTIATPYNNPSQNVPLNAIYYQNGAGVQNGGTKGINGMYSINNIQNSCQCSGPCCCPKDITNLSGNGVPRSSNKFSDIFLVNSPNLNRNVFV